MQIIKGLNLALAFGLELCLLAAVGYWGFVTGQGLLAKVALGIGGPVKVAVVWGVYMAPASARRLGQPWRLATAAVLFALGGAALYSAMQPVLAVLLTLV